MKLLPAQVICFHRLGDRFHKSAKLPIPYRGICQNGTRSRQISCYWSKFHRFYSSNVV